MGIVDEDIAAVRSASDIVAVISSYVQLKRVGRRWTGLCPFHAEKSPSFSVNDQEGLYFCFGCQAKGDVITFVRETEQLDFVGAVEWLANKAGVTLHYTDKDQGEGRKRRAKLVDAVAKAVDWYHERLLTSADAAKARSYLRSRGLDGDEVRTYKIGWAPDTWDELAKALRLPDDILKDSGLGIVNRRNRQQDTFRSRLLFPIFDAQGDPVAFGGRVMPGGEGPKYKNTPETPLYSKSKVLYGLNWAKGAIVNADAAVICEGYTDVIGFARAGVATAVATCGTALTEDHIRMLRRYARRLVLAFDADSAGQAAAERFYAWEKAHEVEVAVADLPPGVDPADLAGSDPERLAAAVEAAKPFLRFRLDRALAAADLRTPEGRARAAETGLAVIREHPSELVRDQYLMELAGHTRVEPDQLRARLRAGPRDPAPIGAGTTRGSERDSPELEVLRHAVWRWEEVSSWLDESLFVDEVHAAAFRALSTTDTLREAIDGADPQTAELLGRLGQEESESEPFETVVRLITETARRHVRRLSASEDRDEMQTAYWLKSRMDELLDPVTAITAAEQLVPWLVEGGEEGP
jgi:DNA primase